MSELGMNKMEKNEIMDTNMEDIKMRTIKELLDSNVSREEMTVEDMLKETERLKKENEKYYEHLQRTAAEFDNYKKRMQNL